MPTEQVVAYIEAELRGKPEHGFAPWTPALEQLSTRLTMLEHSAAIVWIAGYVTAKSAPPPQEETASSPPSSTPPQSPPRS
jgi:hypothetical protein